MANISAMSPVQRTLNVVSTATRTSTIPMRVATQILNTVRICHPKVTAAETCG